MDAREYLETVRAAQRGIDRRLAVIESMQAREQVRAQRYDAVGKGAHGTDFMRSTDDRIDYERRSGAELSELRREVERGRELCAGVRSANPGKRWGDVLELRYCEDRTLQEIDGDSGCVGEVGELRPVRRLGLDGHGRSGGSTIRSWPSCSLN